jgi:hypothetical protein
MTIHAKAPHPGGECGALEMSLPGGFDNYPNTPPRKSWQDKSPAPTGITCAALRMDELREGLIREISRTIAIGLQAHAALLDGDDVLAIETLRRHWIAMRAGIAPLAAELRDLAETGGAP